MYRHTISLLCNPGKILYKSYKCSLINNKHILNKRLNLCIKQNYSSKTPDELKNLEEKNEERNLALNFDGKYKIFRDKDAPVILDVNEEMERIRIDDLNLEEENIDPTADLNFPHGVDGVFKIEDFVEVLRRDKNIKDLFVATVPREYNYVDYIVIVTGISAKHMNALAINVRKIYKSLKYKNEIVPIIEGENSKDWIAIDLGNIAFHIFNYEARLKFDLETLWSVGSEYDDLSNQEKPVNIIDKYKEFLKILEPAQ